MLNIPKNDQSLYPAFYKGSTKLVQWTRLECVIDNIRINKKSEAYMLLLLFALYFSCYYTFKTIKRAAGRAMETARALVCTNTCLTLKE